MPEKLFDPETDLPLRSERRNPFLLTADDLYRRQNLPAAPMGSYLWRLTCEVDMDGPIATARGRTHKEWVYYVRNGKQFVRPFAQPPNPRTAFQVDQRERFVAAQQEWQHLTDAERDAWAKYGVARSAKRYGTVGTRRRCGMNQFTAAQVQRMSWGAPMRHTAPAGPPPKPVLEVEELPAPAGQFAFLIVHAQKDLTGCRLLLEMTPATKSPAHKPLERHLTRAAATDAGSYFPLAASGATYLLDSPRHAIAPGERYALQATLVTDDGIKGEPLLTSHLRRDPGKVAVVAKNSQPLRVPSAKPQPFSSPGVTNATVSNAAVANAPFYRSLDYGTRSVPATLAAAFDQPLRLSG